MRHISPLATPGCIRRVQTWFCAAVRVNETDTFADDEGDGENFFDFEDISGAWPEFLVLAVLQVS